MRLYHGTTRESLQDILRHGLKPYPNWDSGNLPVVSLTSTAELALIEAYVVDATKVQLGEKDTPSQGYVALEVNTKDYRAKKWQVDEWWILETVLPKDISVVREEGYEFVKKMFESRLGNS